MTESKQNIAVESFLLKYSHPRTKKEHRKHLYLLLEYLSNVTGESIEDIDFTKIYRHKFRESIFYKPIDLKLLEDFLVFRKSKGDTPGKYNRIRSSLRMFFEHLVLNEELKFNPALELEPAKVPKKITDSMRLDIEQCKQLMLVAKFHDQNLMAFSLITVLLFTGLRLSEAVSLKEIDMDRLRCMIFVHGKTRDEYQPATDVLIEILKKHIDYNAEARCLYDIKERPMFFWEDGMPLRKRQVNNLLGKLCEKGGVPRITAHWLRRTYAQLLYDSGIQDMFLKEAMRHVNLGTTIQSYIVTDKYEKVRSELDKTITVDIIREKNTKVFQEQRLKSMLQK